MTGTPFDNPIVLITRPAQRAARFLEELRAVAGPFRPLVSPAFELEGVNYARGPFDGAIFTSSAAVEFAPNGEGRVAWCVGRKTAEVAERQGYVVKVGAGNADDLSKMILHERPAGELIYFRGENVRVNVKAVLESAGIPCAEVVAYRKAVNRPTDSFLAPYADHEFLILPVFSAETVSILADWPIVFERSWFIAISEDVGRLAEQLNPIGISCAAHPNLKAMSQASARMIA